MLRRIARSATTAVSNTTLPTDFWNGNSTNVEADVVKRWLDWAGALIMDVPLHHTDTPPEKVGEQRAF